MIFKEFYTIQCPISAINDHLAFVNLRFRLGLHRRVSCHLCVFAVLAPAQLRAAQPRLVTLTVLLQAERFLAIAAPRVLLHLYLWAERLRIYLDHVDDRVVSLGAVLAGVLALHAVTPLAELIVSETLAV